MEYRRRYEDKAIKAVAENAVTTAKAAMWLGSWAFAKAKEAHRRNKTPTDYLPEIAQRFEHTHIVAGSGHGKTQLLQNYIMQDLPAVAEGYCSLIVIDSQGDLLNNILRMEWLSPNHKMKLAERLVLIDPTDLDHPPCLNLFDFGLDRLTDYTPLDWEKLINGAISLYEYLFGALLGAELTQKQGVIFRYIARLLMVVPGATIDTLMDILRDPDGAKPYISKLDATSQRFFETFFFTSAFDNTRQQILTRLWGVLANPVLARMFSYPQNKLNIFREMNRGRVILINTAKDLLKQEGSELFGRFMVALISQAVQERAAITKRERTPTFVYIDEAHDVFDTELETLINTGRKYHCGITFAHQNLGQLDRKLQASIMSSTGTKIVGGLSGDDANVFAREMGIEAKLIQDLRKYHDHSDFMKFCRNENPAIARLSVMFGDMESVPRLKAPEYAKLIEQNQEKYCTPRIAATEKLEAMADYEQRKQFQLEDPEAL